MLARGCGSALGGPAPAPPAPGRAPDRARRRSDNDPGAMGVRAGACGGCAGPAQGGLPPHSHSRADMGALPEAVPEAVLRPATLRAATLVRAPVLLRSCMVAGWGGLGRAGPRCGAGVWGGRATKVAGRMGERVKCAGRPPGAAAGGLVLWLPVAGPGSDPPTPAPRAPEAAGATGASQSADLIRGGAAAAATAAGAAAAAAAARCTLARRALHCGRRFLPGGLPRYRAHTARARPPRRSATRTVPPRPGRHSSRPPAVLVDRRS
jgi:hypothetical protein